MGLWWELNFSFGAAFGRFFCFIHRRKKQCRLHFSRALRERVREWYPPPDTTDSNETINTGACSIVGPTITLKSDSSKLSHNGQLKQPTSANFSAPLYATLRPTAHGAPPLPTTPHLCFILMPLCARFNRFVVVDSGQEMFLYYKFRGYVLSGYLELISND